ncbi:sigma 54-interacting transcriptional regulator [Gottschalkiaceae bacterium SANA]|nr:sigma 54-interacting transcriptional regulator [Gottschalkiaceae bacterium SANA]
MMKKRLGIITSSVDVGNEYKRQILEIFNYSIDVLRYSFDMSASEEVWDVDVLLISTYSQYEVVKKQISSKTIVVISNLTLSKEGLNRLSETKLDKRVALVNLSFEMCIETIATLHQLGFDETQLIPVYPNMENVPKLEMAITTGEARYVPKEMKTIIELGHRVIDRNTIVELAIALKAEEMLEDRRVIDYFSHLASENKGFEYFINQTRAFKKQFSTLVSIMEKGVIGFDHTGVIEMANEKAKQLIGMDRYLKGMRIDELFPGEIMSKYFESRKKLLDQLVQINHRNITLSIFPVSDIGESTEMMTGSYAILDSFETQENTQNRLRLQLANKGHVAKYTVDQIIGESEAIQQVKKLVVRMGNSHSAVMITGESGTGKELIAQAVHNGSPVRDKQFVAINCAAISPSLLESELFGYEAGAFTGALKEGKSGIFELAHNGTLFLDEIGEMPLELQSRFLRVIQEGEVIRVGGQKVIKVNTRIVAATNRDLYSQVQKNKFRKDLYYRLNVLPINVPPLRDRHGDVELLFQYFQKLQGCQFELTAEVLDFFNAYDWEGNIRELRNCVKYFENVGEGLITIEHLPFHMTGNRLAKREVKTQRIGDLNKKESYVLMQFYTAFQNKKKLGRKSISQLAHEDNFFLSEYDVRRILKDLHDLGYIDVSTGRGGSTISKEGIRIVETN